MSTLLNYLKLPNNKGLFYWIKFYYNEFLTAIYQRKVSEIDNSWKGIKIAKTITPEGWSKDNAFKYLEKEWDGKIMRRFKD